MARAFAHWDWKSGLVVAGIEAAVLLSEIGAASVALPEQVTIMATTAPPGAHPRPPGPLLCPYIESSPRTW